VKLIVCSMEVAGQGLTLTRASNVAFLELDWTPAKHDQAEDRCHRIGQRDAVTAYYLLAAETVDETIATLLERKRAVAEQEKSAAELRVRVEEVLHTHAPEFQQQSEIEEARMRVERLRREQ